MGHGISPFIKVAFSKAALRRAVDNNVRYNVNTRRNGIAVIHCLYRRNKSGRIGGGHVGVYSAYRTYRAILPAANAKRSRGCDYVCHCATSFLVEFIQFLFGSFDSLLLGSFL